MNELLIAFSYGFMQRALIVGVLISIVAALIGVVIVLRKSSMIGDGLSHVAFSVFAIAVVLGMAPLWVALPVVAIFACLIMKVGQNRKINNDSLIAILSASSLAIGTIVISISQGVNIDLNSYLFGSILSVSWVDVTIAAILTLIVVLIYIFTYNRIFIIAFDEESARASGVKTNVYNTIFAMICAVVIVLGMRLLGALLISSLIVFPTIIAMKIVKSFKGVVFVSVMISLVGFLTGLIFSYLLNIPTGSTVVVVNLILLAISYVVGLIRNKI